MNGNMVKVLPSAIGLNSKRDIIQLKGIQYFVAIRQSLLFLTSRMENSLTMMKWKLHSSRTAVKEYTTPNSSGGVPLTSHKKVNAGGICGIKLNIKLGETFRWTLISVPVTVLTVIVCVFLMGGGHGTYLPTIFLFPYAMLAALAGDKIGTTSIVLGESIFSLWTNH